MPQERTYLAADLGAGSGRVMAGHYDGSRLRLEEVARFPNEPVAIRGSIHWEILGLYRRVTDGLAKALALWPRTVVSAGIDTWGVDFGLIDADGTLLGMPHAYRDPRTNGMIEHVRSIVPDADLYAATGLQRAFFNTLYQLVAAQRDTPAALEHASRLLFTPDLLNYWLTGVAANERTIASTSMLYDPAARDWARGLINTFGLPERIFGDIVDPGTRLGTARLGNASVDIVTVGAHDTASAVAAIPLAGPGAAYLSSGSWSLLGVELPGPVLTPEAAAANFTNETGLCGRIRFLRNITGLWLIQECRSAWDKASTMGLHYEQLTAAATQARPFTAFIDPDDKAFAAPGDMPARIVHEIEASGQDAPTDRGGITRCIFESLALKYAIVLEDIERVTGSSITQLNVVGGGCRDHLLNQFTANALQRPVIAGPAEATATGNVLAQMIAAGDIASLEQGRELVRQSFETRTYEPQDATRWTEALGRYRSFLAQGQKKG